MSEKSGAAPHDALSITAENTPARGSAMTGPTWLLKLDRPKRLDEVLAINNANAVETSLLDGGAFRTLLDQARYAAGVGAGASVEAFLIALDQDATYDNPNFAWFKARYPAFVYVDRVIVAAEARGRGHGRRLYADLFAWACAAGHTRVVCKVNQRPPNPASDAFHRALGFCPVGEAILPSGKTVRYLEASLSPTPTPPP